MSSPTQRSLALLRSEGFTAEVVERWNPHARLTHDLFGCLDIVAVGRGLTIGCQTTSYPHVAERVDKIRASPALVELDSAGWSVIVHGWRQKGGLWVCREVVLLPGRPVLAPISAP